MAMPTIPVRLNTGEIVQVIVCWSAERVQYTMAFYPEGYVPENVMDMRDPDASLTERLWLQNKARQLRGFPPVFPGALQRMPFGKPQLVK
jgi:hypothetical protein